MVLVGYATILTNQLIQKGKIFVHSRLGNILGDKHELLVEYFISFPTQSFISSL
jgi:hypothetical protein